MRKTNAGFVDQVKRLFQVHENTTMATWTVFVGWSGVWLMRTHAGLPADVCKKKPCKLWNAYHMNWCRISSINSISNRLFSNEWAWHISQCCHLFDGLMQDIIISHVVPTCFQEGKTCEKHAGTYATYFVSKHP